ncbi:3-hydroxybutyrate dehydrogenase [Rhodovarius crocodyli]|uniref:3-hydroxybutyrate dehydrogenase n=1 Tax=Rhodovarius crocodyli TaxID=1979269 RepID=A0A437MEW5_9PROT|nr:3-hydroxybutyrate dehydrogenase [Rhodovarius crocodyli]RVT96177.1 3-hydroxybutyrate dehydrogenase [Rhodovarius crocodyli]
MSDRFLEGQGALVTGSTSGIGLGIAKAFALAGAKVMLNGFGKPEEIAAARAEIGAIMGGGDAPYSAADMSKPASIRDMIADAEKTLGSLDILVNNAGIQFVSPVQDFPDEKWDAIIAINMSSNFHAIKAALPAMLARKRGRIINVASAHGLVASPFKSAYVAAKHGVVGLTKTVAIEIAESPVTCNAICPGFVRTPLAEAQVKPLAEKFGISEEEALKEKLLVHQPNKRWVEVEDVAEMALYLCRPQAGSVNGSALSIDGGWVAN